MVSEGGEQTMSPTALFKLKNEITHDHGGVTEQPIRIDYVLTTLVA